MAEGFNSHQATQDLKQMLKLKDPSVELEIQNVDVGQDSSDSTVNINGNALLNLNVTADKPNILAQRPSLTLVPLPKQKKKHVSRANSAQDSVSLEKKQLPSKVQSAKVTKNKYSKDTDLEKEKTDSGKESADSLSPEELAAQLDSTKLEETPKKIVDKAPLQGSATDNKHNRPDSKKVENAGTRGSSNVNNNKPRPPRHGDEDLNPEFLQKLEQNKIVVLKKKNARFPKAKFFCHLCEYHMDLMEDCLKHLKDNRHCRRIEVSAMDALLKAIPQPTHSQLEALTAAVEKVYQEKGMSKEEQKSRIEVVKRLEKICQEKNPGVSINMYGSSLTGFGLKTADINVDLNSTDKDKKLTALLNEVYILLRDKKDTGFVNVRTDFLAKVPVLLLTDEATGYQVTIAIHCYNAHCSGELLAIYSDFDERVRKLAIAFRYWASIFGLDRHYEGFIPPQALSLMVIYYLQNCTPQVLPIITPPKVTGEEVGDFRQDSPAFERMRKKVMKYAFQKRNESSLGQLWLGLIRFYSLEFDVVTNVVTIRNEVLKRTTKPWNSKKLSVEDPYMTKKNITRMLNNARIYEYWQDAVKKSYYYFGLPRDCKGKSLISDEELKEMRQKMKGSQNHGEGSGRAQQQNQTPTDTRETESDEDVVIPPNPLLAKYTSRLAARNERKSSADDDEDSYTGESSSLTSESLQRSQASSLHNADEASTTSTTESVSHSQTKNKMKVQGNPHNERTTGISKDIDDESDGDEEEDDKLVDPWQDYQLSYQFTKETFLTDGKGPILVCMYCEQEGHLKNNCPEDELPEVLPLPALTSRHVKVLTQTLNRVPSEVGLTDESLAERFLILKNLEIFIQHIPAYEDAQLALFGSSCNGFGFYKSDIDICMTFAKKNNPAKLDKVSIIETLARRLKQHPELACVQAITTAKVPIVKFTVKKIEIEGDISLYNTLAQQNTKLLYCYSQIDPRVQVLGYTIKTFAKVCDIGDASRGSLSSYAYILMMLYYLQQVEPPLIPVLQELYEGTKPSLEIEGSEAWFMDDASQLDRLWPHRGKNQSSVAELWIGFLRFYVEDFNYKELVISIRQYAPLTRFEKLWNGSCLAIEDPFDLNHNLGSGLTRKMTNFIFKTFINGRMLYGSPIDDNMDIFDKYQNPSDYFFDTDLLSENRPINVRGCRKCGRIGHLARHCPERKYEEQKKQLPSTPTKSQQQLSTQYKSQQQQAQYKNTKQHAVVSSQKQTSLVAPQKQQKPQTSQSQVNLSQRGQQNQTSGKDTERRERGQASQGAQGNSSANANKNQSPQAVSSGQLSMNLSSNPHLHQVTPTQLRSFHQGQVFHNSQYLQSQQYPQHHMMQHHHPHQPPHMPQHLSSPQQMQQQQQLQQQLHLQQQHNNPGNMPPGIYPPQMMLTRPAMSPPTNFGYMPSNANYSNTGYPYNSPLMSGQGGVPQLARNQFSMNPVVQNLFASAHNQILDASSNQTQIRKQ